MRFAALDFETANMARNSACAVAIAVVENGEILRTWSTLIRPPRNHFQFTYIHGITAEDVASAPTFAEVHAEILAHFEGVAFIAAHNASFDKSVMRAACDHFGLANPAAPWACTVKIARNAWDLRPTKLPDVCRHLGLPLKHHDALSDTVACARIAIAAHAELSARGISIAPQPANPSPRAARKPRRGAATVSPAPTQAETTSSFETPRVRTISGRDHVAEMRAAIARLNRA